MAVPELTVEEPHAGVVVNVPLAIDIQTSGLPIDVLVFYGSLKQLAVQGVDYTIDWAGNNPAAPGADLSTFNITPLAALMTKITADGTNIIYVQRRLTFTSDFDLENAFVRQKLVDEFNRIWFSVQQLDFLQGDTANAADSALAAAVSASEALASQLAAAASAVTATTQAGIAGVQAGNAATSATAAAGSATAANTSKVNAATSETNAAASAAAALTSKNNAATSETNAAASATAANTSKVNAATSETNAAASAAAALTSKNNAATSETNASNSAAAAAASAATFSLPTGYLFGGILSNNGADAVNDIDIAAGKCRSDDDTTDMTIPALTKRLDAAWAVGSGNGGLDTGAIANVTYHMWVIKRTDTNVVDVLFSASATAPTMPTNYTKKRRIGSIVRAAAAIRGFKQSGDRFRWLQTLLDVDVTNPGTAAVSRTLTVPLGIIVHADIAVHVFGITSGSIFTLITALDETDRAPSGGDASLIIGNTTVRYGSVALGIKTNTSGQIRSRHDASGASDILRIDTFGYTDTRGRLE